MSNSRSVLSLIVIVAMTTTTTSLDAADVTYADSRLARSASPK